MARSIRNLPFQKIKIPRLPQVTDEPDIFEEMTLQEHLEELRDRILKMVLAIVPTFIFGFVISNRILEEIRDKANAGGGLDIRSPTDPLTLSFKIGLYVAIAICMPIIVYQLIAFLAPGLTRKEKRILYSSLPFISVLFIGGVAYGYLVAAPRALYFLSNWNSAVNWEPDGPEVVSFFLTLMIGLGLAFQLPVIMFVLAKIGIVSPQKMRAVRKYAFMALLVVAAIITPSTDPFNMAIVAIPLIVLYEVGIIISSIFAKTGVRSQNFATDSVQDLKPVAGTAEKAGDI